MLLGAAAYTLWRNSDPWREIRTLTGVDSGTVNRYLSPDGKWFLSDFRQKVPNSDDQYYYLTKLWDVSTGEAKVIMDLKGPGGDKDTDDGFSTRYSSNAFSNDSTYLLLCYSNKHVSFFKFWNLRTDTEVRIPGLDPEQVIDAMFSQKDHYLLLFLKNDIIKLFDLKSFKLIVTIPSVRYVRFSADCSKLAVLNLENTIQLFDTASGLDIQTIPAQPGWEFLNCTLLSYDVLLAEAVRTEHHRENFDARSVFHFNLRNSEQPELFGGCIESISRTENVAIFGGERECYIVDLRIPAVTAQLETSVDISQRSFWLIKDDTRVLSQYEGYILDGATGRRLHQSRYDIISSTRDDARYIVTYYTKSNQFDWALYNIDTGERIQFFTGDYSSVGFTLDSQSFVVQDSKTFNFHVWTRHRPEKWWGILYLPEFWVFFLLLGATIFSLVRSRGQRATLKQ